MKRLTSFVVLNWNGGRTTLDCVRSIHSQTDEPFECVLVDNGSTDGSTKLIQQHFPAVRLVSHTANLGFAAGMNSGLAIAEGDILVPTNQDVALHHTFAQQTRKVFEQDSRIGSVGGVIMRLHGNERTSQFDGGGYYLRRRLSVGSVGPITNGQIDVFGVAGCCPAFRRETLVDVALDEQEYYDSDYFLYYEDIDLFFRIQLRAWRVVYSSDVRAWHHRSLSSGGGRRFYQKPLWVQRYHYRNRYLTLMKNCPADLAHQLLPGMAAAELATWPYLLVRSPRSIPALVGSWAAVIQSLPATIRKRQVIQNRRAVSGSALRRLVRGL